MVKKMACIIMVVVVLFSSIFVPRQNVYATSVGVDPTLGYGLFYAIMALLGYTVYSTGDVQKDRQSNIDMYNEMLGNPAYADQYRQIVNEIRNEYAKDSIEKIYKDIQYLTLKRLKSLAGVVDGFITEKALDNGVDIDTVAIGQSIPFRYNGKYFYNVTSKTTYFQLVDKLYTIYGVTLNDNYDYAYTFNYNTLPSVVAYLYVWNKSSNAKLVHREGLYQIDILTSSGIAVPVYSIALVNGGFYNYSNILTTSATYSFVDGFATSYDGSVAPRVHAIDNWDVYIGRTAQNVIDNIASDDDETRVVPIDLPMEVSVSRETTEETTDTKDLEKATELTQADVIAGDDVISGGSDGIPIPTLPKVGNILPWHYVTELIVKASRGVNFILRIYNEVPYDIRLCGYATIVVLLFGGLVIKVGGV